MRTSNDIAEVRTRRAFCATCGRVALGLPLLSLAGCSRDESATPPKVAAAPAGDGWDDLIAELEKLLPDLLAKATTVPAVSMALVADAKLRWQGAYGVKDFETKAPVDTDTVFEAASVSKTVFAYEILKLCERGVMDLDTPLTTYTTDRFLKGDPRLDLITARHVLSHRTGFPNWRSEKEPLAIGFTPGKRWSYSGEGYYYLQSVMTHLTGHVDTTMCKVLDQGIEVCATDFDGNMRTNLFVPFGMTWSGYLYREGMARPHDEKGKMIADRKATPIEAARFGSAGDLHTTPTDYARFLIEILDPKPADRYRLSKATLDEMVRPQVKLTDSLSWGLGWAIDHKKTAGDIISHSGDNPGFKTMTAASREKKNGFIIMTNGDRGFDQIIVNVMMSEPMQRFLPVTVGG
jgi:CubicO group peptidase (beta-lactamase class C family)